MTRSTALAPANRVKCKVFPAVATAGRKMLDSLTKTMSRSGGLVGGLNKKPNASNNSLGGVGGSANITAGSGTLSNGSHNSSTAGGRGMFQAQVVFLDDSGQVSFAHFFDCLRLSPLLSKEYTLLGIPSFARF